MGSRDFKDSALAIRPQPTGRHAMMEFEQTIRFNRRKLLLFCVPFVLLLFLSVVVNPDSWRNGPVWPHFVFGGLAACVAAACVVLPRRYYLHLSPEGMIFQTLWRRRHFSWREVRNFRVDQQIVQNVAFARKVVFDLTPDSPQRTKLVELTSEFNGYDVAIFCTFNLSAHEVAALLNEWQYAFGGEGVADL
jgi:hypothetical protein